MPDHPFRVLMVDDEELIRRLAAAAARRAQIEMVTTATAGEALAEAGSSPVDVLVADVVLPPAGGASGIDLARQVAAMHPGVSIVLISGYNESHFDLTGLPADTRFLSKPFSGMALATLLQGLRDTAQPGA